jgi:hypothetical protein
MAPTPAFGSVVRNAKMSLVASPSLTLRTDVQLVQMPAKQARGRESSKANQMSPPSALLWLSAPSHRVQCLLSRADVGRAAVRLYPEQLLEVDRLPLASSFAARFLVASTRACCDDGIPQRAVASSRLSAPLRTIGAL